MPLVSALASEAMRRTSSRVSEPGREWEDCMDRFLRRNLQSSARHRPKRSSSRKS